MTLAVRTKLKFAVALLAISSLVWALDSPEERAQALSSHIELAIPEGDGAHPLAILLPGCLGWHPHHDKWQDDLLKRGFAVLHIDSFAARGVEDRGTLEREVCSGLRIPGAERAGDLMAVLGTVWSRADIQADKTILMGWSHGGWTAMDFMVLTETASLPPTLSALPALDTSNIRAAFLFYPYCGLGSLTGENGFPPGIKTRVFHGSADTITDPRQCRARVEALAAGGADIEYVALRGARHWFDNHTEPATFDRGASSRATALIDAALDAFGPE